MAKMQPPPRRVGDFLFTDGNVLKHACISCHYRQPNGFTASLWCCFLQVKHTVVLKNVHTEQLSKLQAKHQQETELLEDIRSVKPFNETMLWNPHNVYKISTGFSVNIASHFQHA